MTHTATPLSVPPISPVAVSHTFYYSSALYHHLLTLTDQHECVEDCPFLLLQLCCFFQHPHYHRDFIQTYERMCGHHVTQNFSHHHHGHSIFVLILAQITGLGNVLHFVHKSCFNETIPEELVTPGF